jgi:hypothetical protein
MLPIISWPEAGSESEMARVRDEIIATLTLYLEPAGQCQRVYALVATPMLSPPAESRLLSAVQAEAAFGDPLRRVELPGGGRCYVCATQQTFASLLLPAFQFGPPEITLIGANCPHPGDAPNLLSRFLMAQLQRSSDPERSVAVLRDSVGMHFDSGDLVEIF